MVSPINDTARIQQRDALVAYILQQARRRLRTVNRSAQTTSDGRCHRRHPADCTGAAGVTAGMLVQGASIAPGTVVTARRPANTDHYQRRASSAPHARPRSARSLLVPPGPAVSTPPDSLFEYFLIDPQTQPPVLTSRILLALSAVQLFIERVVRNLEPQVSPADIDASQWTWMKRYRVWQANREVFLWPENWLYPELRDNQSPFFQQTMSACCRATSPTTPPPAPTSTISPASRRSRSSSRAACTTSRATADADETSYVVARTAGAHRKYYFRQLHVGQLDAVEPRSRSTARTCRSRRSSGTAGCSCSGSRSSNRPSRARPTSARSEIPKSSNFQAGDLQTFAQDTQAKNQVAISAILCWSEFYNGKWQPTKTSDVNLPTSLSFFGNNGGGLGVFDATGPCSFEQSTRGLLRLVPAQFTGASFVAQSVGAQFTLPSDALILAIVCEGLTNEGLSNPTPFGIGGFLLHNTHSLPVRLDDILVPSIEFEVPTPLWWYLDLPSPSRTLWAVQPQPCDTTLLPPFSGAFGSGTFTITYEDVEYEGAVWTNPVLGYNWMPRFAEPQPALPGAWPQGALTGAWEAPFIYEDRRHVFYVKTTETVTAFGGYEGFGISSASRLTTASSAAISPLVLRKPVTTATPGEIAAINAARGGVSAIQRYLQGTDLNAAVISPTAVIYQGRVISPIGSVPAPAPVAADNGKGA